MPIIRRKCSNVKVFARRGVMKHKIGGLPKKGRRCYIGVTNRFENRLGGGSDAYNHSSINV